MTDKAAAKKPAASPKAAAPKAGGDKPAAKAAAPKTAEKKPADKPAAAAPAKQAAAPKTAEKKVEKPAEKPAPKAAAPKQAAAPKTEAPAKKAAAAPKQAKAEVKRTPYKPVQAAGSPAPVPESLFKKQQRDAELATKAAAHKIKSRKAARVSRKGIYQRAEKYAAEYRAQEKNLVRLKRQAKNTNNLYIAPEPKVVFALRVRGIMRTSPKTTSIMRLLRLRQVHNGVFIRMNKAAATLLRLVEPYVAYGEPNLKTVRDLVYKRGFGKVGKQRIPFTDNAVIADSLGKFGIKSTEDLIHEIYTVGPHFKEANNFLWPFKLNSPLGGWTDKGTHYAEGGDAGNREEDINALVRRMN